MRRLSIRLKVTLWFVLLMTVLVAVVLAFLFYASGRQALAAAEAQLRGMVQGSLDEIECDDGRLEIDDDLEYFDRGAYLLVQAENGGLLFGRPPGAFDTGAAFSDARVHTVAAGGESWCIYDERHNIRGYGDIWVRAVTSVAGLQTGADSMLRFALIGLPFLVLLSALGGYALVSRAFGPIRQITAAAEAIGESRDLSRRIALGEGRDEIYTLARTFDGMFARLQEAFENEKRFTADVSHELRTPTSVILSQCEYSLAHAQTLEEAKNALASVLDEAEKMSGLIAQILTLARADKGHAKLQMELVNLSEVSALVAEQMREIAAEQGMDVETDIEPGLLLHGDETMLMRLVINLAENGVRYGRQGGRLHIRLAQRDGCICGEVADDGIGIAPGHLDKIWGRFYQVDAARSGGGAGLGLAMVKYIAEAHGGTVSVASEEGRGSVFSFRLPQK